MASRPKAAKKSVSKKAVKKSMANPLVTSLEDHINRVYGMVLQAVKGFSDAQWVEGSVERMQPARIVYHIFQSTERYTWRGRPEEYVATRKFSQDWEETPARDLPGRALACEHLELVRDWTLEWVRQAGDDLLGKPMWPWVGGTKLAQCLYHLRNVQHHMGELNVELQRRSLPIVEWQ